MSVVSVAFGFKHSSYVYFVRQDLVSVASIAVLALDVLILRNKK